MGTPDTANKRRLFYLFLMIGVIFLVLIGRLFYVQVIWGPELQEKALNQQTMDTSLSPARGRILDRDGQVLAQSGTAYTVLLNPKVIDSKNPTDRPRIAQELATILGLEYNSVLAKVSDTSKEQIVLKRQVERDTVDQIENALLGTGVTFGIDSKRYYPMESMLAQTLGFTTVDSVGQEGLEREYNKYLAGEPGRLITEKDRDNRPLAYGTEEYIPPVNGCDLVLTTDSVVQSFLEKALDEALKVNDASSAQGVIINPKTGEIIAIATTPDFDPNSPPRDDIDLLRQLVKNRIVSDAYEPGSTFKILTLSSALDSGAVNMSSTFECAGGREVNGEWIKCWKKSHGHQNLLEAVQHSCNPAFMTMALAMGKETFYDYIYKYGIGSSTESGLTGESGGIVIHEKYIRENNLARIGFGQSIAVTPMQLVTAVSASINGGNLMQPYIVAQILGADGTVIKENKPTVVRRVISGESSETVRSILESVVAEGSGRNAQIPGYRVGGKTGTAQKYVDGKVSSGSLIASFIGFAPAEDPELLCLILVDEPKVGVIFGSTVAAPFVKDVLEETLMHYGVKPSETQETVEVPDVTGQSAKKAQEALKQLGLTGEVTEGEEDATVARQAPTAGGIVVKGSGVLLYTEMTGAEPGTQPEDTVKVPNVIGKTKLEAYDALRAAGLTLRIDPADQTGKATKQQPAAGEKAPVGAEVTVDFLSGNG